MYIIVVDINQHGGDFVITYSLDNYITIKGIINGNVVDDEGYLIDENEINVEDDKVTYKRNRNCKRKLERIFIRRRWNYR